jgi:broad specificity phosphatase PhoE
MNAVQVFLVRHGETDWSLTGRHTSVTDLPLTDCGKSEARQLAPVLAQEQFALVLTSPMRRARTTSALAGFGNRAEVDPDLREWDYGEYEGLTQDEIDARAPGWMLFRDGCPHGETPAQVGARVDRIIERIRAVHGNVALFAHGHVFRTLAAHWIGLTTCAGQYFLLDTATLNILSYYHGSPAIKRWNAPLGLRVEEERLEDS